MLIVGAGPAGLDCALTLAKRGYEVVVADRGRRAGGRLLAETELPGLATWRRVLDYRLAGLAGRANASIFLDSDMGADDVLGFGAERVVIATGSDWLARAYDPRMEAPGAPIEGPSVFTPEDVFAGVPIAGPVAVFDYDNYYMGSCIAEALALRGLAVTYVTPAGHASAWTIMTNEQPNIHAALQRRGIAVLTRQHVADYTDARLELADVFTDMRTDLLCRSLIVVGMRRPRAALYDALMARQAEWRDGGVRSVDRIGDALAPGAIVHAVHSGHLYARGLDVPEDELPYRIDHGLDVPAPVWKQKKALLFEKRSKNFGLLVGGFCGLGGATSTSTGNGVLGMNAPVNSAMQPSLPSSAYTDPAHFALERAQIFTAEWMVACRAEEIPRPGDWRVFDIAGDDVLVIRGKDGTLRAFFNVCRHRGARLCAAVDEPAKPGRAALPQSVLANGFVRCPYHAWLYDTEGRLIGAPFLAEGADFRRADFSLYPVSCAEWGGFVFLHTTPEHAGSLPDQLGPIPARLANYRLADLRIGHRTHYTVDANWKILCENYNECYHCGRCTRSSAPWSPPSAPPAAAASNGNAAYRTARAPTPSPGAARRPAHRSRI